MAYLTKQEIKSNLSKAYRTIVDNEKLDVMYDYLMAQSLSKNEIYTTALKNEVEVEVLYRIQRTKQIIAK